MKNNSILLLILLTLSFYGSSCKRQWECTAYAYGILAVKGEDTIQSYMSLGGPYNYYSGYNSSYFQAMYSYYSNNGYSLLIDSQYIGGYGNITDYSEVKALEDNGYKCATKNE